MQDPTGPLAGARIGAYRIVRALGAGGMGAVYLAERDDAQFQKAAAIKLVHRGVLSEEAVRRFSDERQTLARLDHPHIVRLLDGGTTTDGIPYLVMDYVQGVSIDRYCGEHQLSATGRLQLFLLVCGAVHYAHQHLVIHCDIKAGNILVTPEGQPKLLDFGIAKLLDPRWSGEGAGSEGGLRPMTPEAASPEQLRGEPITTASDVYALGIVLYKLLTGRAPHNLDSGSAAGWMRRILEDDPDPPGLGPDLDAVLLMALQRDTQRRYRSVEQFADDLRRYLEGRPVSARESTPRYVAGKFARRNKLPVALAAALLAALLGGLIATARESRLAQRQWARAERRFNDVRKLSRSLFDIHDQIRALPGSTPARQLLVARALEYHNSLVQEAGGDPGLQQELAEGYLKLGDLQGNPYEANIGDANGALASYRRALEVGEALVRALPADRKPKEFVARCYSRISDVLPLLGKLPEAVAQHRKAIGILESLSDADPRDVATRIELAVSYEGLGDQLGHPGILNLGDRGGALASYQKALVVWEVIAQAEPRNQRARRAIAIQHMKIADMRSAAEDAAGARRDYQEALRIFEALSAEDPVNVPARRTLAMMYRKWGEFLGETGDTAEALAALAKAAPIYEQIAAADPANSQAKMDLVTVLRSRLTLKPRQEDVAGALADGTRGLQILEELARRDPSDKLIRERLSNFLLMVSDLVARSGDAARAQRMTARSFTLQKELADDPDAPPDTVHEYAKFLLVWSQGRQQEALRYAERACKMTKFEEPEYLDTLALAYLQNGDRARALESGQRALALLPPAAPGGRPSPLRLRITSRLETIQKGR